MTVNSAEVPGQLRVVRVLRNGKRWFDPVEKERLIDACLEPGVSVAGLALAHGINANQLRKWVKLRQDRKATEKAALTVMPSGAPSAFVPVVETTPMARLPAPSARPPAARVRVTAALPNGVRLELDDADAQVLSAMIEALGRCHVPAR
ncbi:transposase [Microvirga sp. VF16]|uniref:IS66-like element accessory protein TnpA n=1 Tax=Microvirga sp. VF16 TaxID=2807101 RepID=UPI00193D2F9B|nr:transposase [Microvirga sp. VF16]QRM33633.1 transposase [Microvirga sp. VF16]QRM34290.1 transposase [Microvirga sp. VF16]